MLNKLAEAIPELIGGSADLTPSNLTKFKGALDFQVREACGGPSKLGEDTHQSLPEKPQARGRVAAFTLRSLEKLPRLGVSTKSSGSP